MLRCPWRAAHRFQPGRFRADPKLSGFQAGSLVVCRVSGPKIGPGALRPRSFGQDRPFFLDLIGLQSDREIKRATSARGRQSMGIWKRTFGVGGKGRTFCVSGRPGAWAAAKGCSQWPQVGGS